MNSLYQHEGEILTSWGSSIVLDTDERIVNSWQSTREIIEENAPEKAAERKTMWKVKERRKGYLVLTTKRLLFLEERNTVEKTYQQTVAVPLTEIEDIWMEKVATNPIPENGDGKAHVFHLAKIGEKKNFEKFKQLIENYRPRNKDSQSEVEKTEPSIWGPKTQSATSNVG